jgi:hypothetical protein
MVPPVITSIDVGDEPPIVRIGAQKTYVFYKDGIETFVIRPGFLGKIEEFGMLIPFPSPPAIRKVPDEIFAHIAAAVDPPEVVVDRRMFGGGFGGGGFGGGIGGGGGGFGGGGLGIRKDEVRVLREEAVGMYEVAVLAAGSAKALNRWMDDQGFKYPDGMDAACNDYVNNGWGFVAVKTRVGLKKGVDPKPGMRKIKAKLPAGARFDGHVQAMGFRFRSRQLVVPMRLSAFNKGKLRNIVYLLTKSPAAIESMSRKFVVRQVSGERLFKNLTRPLPVRLIEPRAEKGTKRGVKAFQEAIKAANFLGRDPRPKNGLARELFASDLIAAKQGRLSLRHEEKEKAMQRIGERLDLRGSEIDSLNRDASRRQREKTVRRSLRHLKQMTLTVIDGDFPREMLAKQNLTFVTYTMPSSRNSSRSYDANVQGPPPKKAGVLILGALAPETENSTTHASGNRQTGDSAATTKISEGSNRVEFPSPRHWAIRKSGWPWMGAAACVLIGLAVTGRFRSRRGLHVG